MKTLKNLLSSVVYDPECEHFPKARRLSSRLFVPAAALLMCVADASLKAGEPEAGSPSVGRVTLAQAPAGAATFTIPLAVVDTAESRSMGFLSQRSPRSLDEIGSVPLAIASAYSGKEFWAYQIAAFPDGARYVAALNEDNTLKFLNRNDSGGFWFARVYLLPSESEAKPELIKEGYQTTGNDVLIPVELQLPGIGTTRLKHLKTEIGYSISGTQNGKPSVYSGRSTSLQVTGSQVMKEGKLTVTVTVPDEMTVTPETQVTLRFQPLQPGLPEHTASGRVTDFLTIGAARFVVTAMPPDFSSASLTLVAGDLEQMLRQQLQLGARMPAFAQVDLVTRKTVTQKEVLTRAKASGVVFVFGDLESAAGRFGPYGSGFRPPGGVMLPLPVAEIADQLGSQPSAKPLLVMVTRQIGLDFLYTELRNKTPEYLVLADYTDPLRTGFRQPQGNMGPWYGSSYGGGQEASLRQLFNLPGNTIAVIAFDGQGNVRYVKAEAAGSFLPSLVEARAALSPKAVR